MSQKKTKKKAPSFKAAEYVAAPPFWWIEFKFKDEVRREAVAFWILGKDRTLRAAIADGEGNLEVYLPGNYKEIGITVKFIFDPHYEPPKDYGRFDLPRLDPRSRN
jgi:hypothetical protein